MDLEQHPTSHIGANDPLAMHMWGAKVPLRIQTATAHTPTQENLVPDHLRRVPRSFQAQLEEYEPKTEGGVTNYVRLKLPEHTITLTEVQVLPHVLRQLLNRLPCQETTRQAPD